MASARFDIQFAGELMEDVDPKRARSELQRFFKLSDEAVEKLFTGDAVTIKRGADTATASGYRKIFREAGALVRILPVEDEPTSGAAAPPIAQKAFAPTASVGAPIDGQPTPESQTQIESAQATAEPAPAAHPDRAQAEQHPSGPQETTPEPGSIDTSHLSLVQGSNWTLEDCENPPEPINVPDISHLRLVEPAPAENAQD